MHRNLSAVAFRAGPYSRKFPTLAKAASAWLAVLVLALPLRAADRDPALPADLSEGIDLHNAALAKPDLETIQKAKSLLEPLAERIPLAKAYYGSAISLEAGAEAKGGNALKALALLDDSSRLIDQALASDSENPELRFLRMENCYGVSSDSPVNRWPVMKEDLDWLDRRRAAFASAERAVIDLYAGLYLARSRDIEGALDAWDSCVREAPQSPEAAEARALLAKYGD